MNDEYLIYGETLTNIANSIRSVSSVSTTWTPDEMAAYILANLVKPTTRQAAKTYTPSTSNQTIPAGTFLTGAATIQGDADWVPGNIKKGVNMWGKTGTLSGIWGDPSTFYGLTAVKSGSFTVSSSSPPHFSDSSYKVTHNLGVVPKIIIYCGTNVTAPISDVSDGFYQSCAIQQSVYVNLSGMISGANISSISSKKNLLPGGGSTSSYDGNITNNIANSFSIDLSYVYGYYSDNPDLDFAIEQCGLQMGKTYKWLVMG